MESDEAVLRVKEFADGTVCEVEQLIEVARREHALDYFRDDLAFRVRPPTLRDVKSQDKLRAAAAVIEGVRRNLHIDH